MLLGVLIQVTSFAGHKAAEQFVIGRIITGTLLLGPGVLPRRTLIAPPYQVSGTAW